MRVEGLLERPEPELDLVRILEIDHLSLFSLTGG